uniref:LOW QUALITY PROTEIN: thrombospondin type-1 domain-containing protein 7A-like n=1 Tax=Dermatophagoides pteronyssinus TaxID=6956 RepID=A0A6P6Y7C3_DERPT
RRCWDKDCEVGPWSPWSACSSTCGPGGFQTRKRSVTQKPTGSGKRCPELTEKHCQVSEWSPWTSCSTSCGSGIETELLQAVLPAEPRRKLFTESEAH